jgi:hypothetical protein
MIVTTTTLAASLDTTDMLERLAALIPHARDVAPLDPASTASTSLLDCDERDAAIFIAAVATVLLATRMGIRLPVLRPNCEFGHLALSNDGTEVHIFHPSARVRRMVQTAIETQSHGTRVSGSCLVISL